MKKAIKGHIIHAPNPSEYAIDENSWIVYEDGCVVGIYSTLPEELNGIEAVDYGDKLIIPGFVDLHLHAPQFANRGLGLDKELLPWLETYTFPEETKYQDMDYAYRAYSKVVKQLWANGTTRSVIFATVHRPASQLLMDLLAKAGLGAYVGKVNMDRNTPDFLVETTEGSLRETERFIQETAGKYDIIKPIITPRFVPTCSPALMQGLGELSAQYNVPVQSHLSENTGEIAWVKELHPDIENYASVYDHFGLFGQQPTVMAHCVHVSDSEIQLMAKNQVFVAHSPHSNNNLSSGIAPIRKMMQMGVPVGLASDVSGSHEVSMPRVIAAAAQVSKLKWLEMDKEFAALNTPELFHLATKGGGKFFGNVGSFEVGYEMDALIIDDTSLEDVNERSLEERIQRYLYCGDDRNIHKRYIKGKLSEEPVF